MADRNDKDLAWVGSSRDDLRAFPEDAKQVAGRQLRNVQQGRDPDHWKPMPDVGAGVAEIIIDTGDEYRVFFVAKFEEAVYVLHAFQKTTRKTERRDIEIGEKRYRSVTAARLAAKQRRTRK